MFIFNFIIDVKYDARFNIFQSDFFIHDFYDKKVTITKKVIDL